MMGHEGVRRLTEHMLAEQLPARLAVIRSAVPPVPVDNAPPTWPPDPHVFCADVIPDRSDWFPAVMVGSAKLRAMKATEGGSAGIHWTCDYDLDIAVAVVAAQAGGDVLASVGRDRLLLALRETLLVHPKIAPWAWLSMRGVTEETGPISEDMAARPMSGGVVTLTCQTVESVDEHRWNVRRTDVGIEVASAEQPFSPQMTPQMTPPQPWRDDDRIVIKKGSPA